jgi:hypothetical protein
MSQQNKTTLQSAINTQLADNLSGDISAADVRDNLINMTDSLLFNTGSGQAITGSLTITGGVTLVSASTSQTVGEGAINLQSTSSTIIPSVILATSNGLKWIKIGHSGGYNSIASAGDTWIYGSTSLNLESNNDVNVWSRLNATQGIIVTGSINGTGSVSLGVPNMFGNKNLDISFNNGIETATLAAGVNSSKTNTIELIGQTGTTNVRAENIFYLFSPIANIVAPTTNITGSLTVTGSTSLNGLMTLQPANPLPSVTNGSIAYSSSGDFYFGSGSAWRKLTL